MFLFACNNSSKFAKKIMNLFGRNKKENFGIQPKKNSQFPWIQLTSFEQLDKIKRVSLTKPVVIFKHSTRCIVSRIVLREFESSFLKDQPDVSLYFLDLLTYRDVSNEIGSVFQVFHQSPQVIVVKNGQAVYHASHNDVNSNNIKEFV